jgi:parallel beta-helix repeat protein
MIANNIITRNLAADGTAGGILLSYSSSLTVANCTITDNVGYYGDGGIVLIYSSYMELTNSIVWDNNREQVACHLGSNAEVRYSNIEGGYAGIGNIDADPCFADAPNADYHLLPSSPCINAGDPYYVPGPNEMDLDGRPRIIGGRIDMGAYEYSPPISAEVRIVPRTINLASKGNWITCYIWLPEGYNVADIDSSSVLLEDEIEPQWVWFDEEEQVAMVRFSREEVQAVLNIGEVELTITGQLTDGTVFEAKDVIIVINKGSRKSAK